jgi:hypothetical protein
VISEAEKMVKGDKGLEEHTDTDSKSSCWDFNIF